MKNRKTKKAFSLIIKKTVVVLIAVVLSVFAFLLALYAVCGVLSCGYHNDTINTLYTASGKCTNITDIHHRSSKTLFHLTIGGKEYTLAVAATPYTSREERDAFEAKVMAADSITIQYVISLDDDLIFQSLEIPGDRQYVDLEEVKKYNYTQSNLMFCMMLFCYIVVQILIIIFTHSKLKKLPSVKTALRRAKRKKERAEQLES